jgi:putative membrane protein
MLRFVNASGTDLVKGALAGLCGGLAATWMMTRLQEAVPPDRIKGLLGESDGQDEEPQAGDSEGGGEDAPATVKAADALAEAVTGREIPEERKSAAGQAVHYAFGTSAGLAYGVVAEPFPQVTSVGGLAFGSAFWLAADEIGVPAFGLSEPAWRHPASTHLYSFVSHLVYGLTLESVRRGLRALI